MKLILAEKPLLGSAIAEALPPPQRKQKGYITCGDGYVVTWCVGHMFEQAEPVAYHARYARWCLTDLPIVPLKWQLLPRQAVSSQLRVIKTLLRQASHIIHAGDPDREGQLLVDEVLHQTRHTYSQKIPIERCLINDLNPTAIQRALSQLQNNRDFLPLCISALARARRLALRY